MTAKNDFSRGSIAGNILRLALPMTLAQLINVLYSVVDRIYLGHMPGVGQTALTAVGVTMPIVSILMGFANLCGVGGAPLCSIERGKGDNEEAERVMGHSFAMLLMLGVVVTVGLQIVKAPVLRLLGASDVTLPYAVDYLEIYLCGTLFVMISLGMNPFINSQGFARTGMLTVALGAVVNLILDPIFIFWLEMGIRGAALATVIAQGCSAVWVLCFLRSDKAILRLRRDCMKLEAQRVKKIFNLGLSGFFVNLTNSVVQIACNATLQLFGGDLFVGIMTILNSVREVLVMPVMGITNASQPVMGFNYGAEKYGRVRSAIHFTSVVTVTYSVFVWMVTMLFPAFLFGVFNADSEVIAMGTPSMRLYFCMFVFMSLQMAGQNTFVALGRAKTAIFFSLFRKVIVNAPLTLLLPRLGMGTAGVFAAEAISQVVGGLACFITMIITLYRPLTRLAKDERKEGT